MFKILLPDLTRSCRRDHITPVLISLHWLPVIFRIQYKILLNTFKALNGLSPVYIQDLVRTYNPTRSLRSEDLCLLVKPSVRTKMYGDRRFDVASSSLWNDLPKILRTESSINVFKRNLKTHLFKKAFNLWILYWHELLLSFSLCMYPVFSYVLCYITLFYRHFVISYSSSW